MKVKFVPQGIECEIKLGESVLHVAQDNGIYIKSVCKGVPSCAECRVRIVDGDHNVLPPGSEELSLIGNGYFIDRRRLACQLKCFGDITVDTSEQIAKQQEMLSGPKKKLLAQDDRIEDTHTIRSEEQGDDVSANEGEEGVEDDSEEEAAAEVAEEAGAGAEASAKSAPQAQGGKRRRRRRGRRGRNSGSGGRR